MWRAGVDSKFSNTESADDDWETDPDFVNDVTEQEQRFGSKTVEGSGQQRVVDMNQLRDNVIDSDKKNKEAQGPKYSYGYGGQFGVQKDRMDKSAVSNAYQYAADKHSSQTDFKQGFGGKFGVQKDRQDKSAVGYDYTGKAALHSSQQDYSKGFGGKFGVETDKQDKSAENWSYVGKAELHQSQKDHSKGFGGKFGVEKDNQDKSAENWSYVGKADLHQSQKDYSHGFGGKYGVQTDRKDESAESWSYVGKAELHESQKDYSQGFGGKFGVQSDRQDKAAFGFQEVTKPELHPSQKDYSKGFGGKYGASEDKQGEQIPNQETAAEAEAPTTQKADITPGSLSKLRDRFEKNTMKEEEIKTEAERSIEFNANPETVQAEPENTTSTSVNDQNDAPECDQHHTDQNEEPQAISEQQLHKDESDQTAEQQEAVTDTGKSARVIFDYKADADDELTLIPGEIVSNISVIDDGWWIGECKGLRGMFPSNYVETIQ